MPRNDATTLPEINLPAVDREASGTTPAACASVPDYRSLGTWYQSIKAVFDFALALILFVLTVPVMALTGLLVKLTSSGPIIYSQLRVGRHGRIFWIYKIRTMTHDCEKQSGAKWAIRHDPRITPLGHMLRVTHLDELPQLWNVLKGDMSLVGPRPERPEFVPRLDSAIPHYCERLRVRPGVTGLAQVQLPADTDLASVRRKLAWDLYYIEYMGLWLDFKLVACTVLKMAHVPFHLAGRLLRVPGRPVIGWEAAAEPAEALVKTLEHAALEVTAVEQPVFAAEAV
jgi:lipopolysaccharide/colanic/teichoic acid biosynthesis glycosyltransferase